MHVNGERFFGFFMNTWERGRYVQSFFHHLIDERKRAQSPHLWTLYHSTPDFTPANFFLFPKEKTEIKRFQQVKDINAKLNAIKGDDTLKGNNYSLSLSLSLSLFGVYTESWKFIVGPHIKYVQ